jgi:hypothetical protein
MGLGFSDLFTEGHGAQANPADFEVTMAKTGALHARGFLLTSAEVCSKCAAATHGSQNARAMSLRTHRTPRARLLLLVAVAHLVALSLLQAAGVWSDRTPQRPAGEALIVRLLADPPLAVRPAARPMAGAPSTAVDATRRSAKPADAVDVPAAAALPLPQALSAGGTAGVTEPAVLPVRPLVLDLPRKASAPWAPRHPALDDPRANSTRQTLESRLAHALGTAPVTEEHLGDGRLRFRKGSECIELRPNSAGQLSPFNESVSPSNRLATNC